MPTMPTGSIITDPSKRLIARRVMIFFAILASGGNLLLPKEILYAGFVLPALLLRYPTELLTKNHRIIWLFLLTFVVIGTIGLASDSAGGFAGRMLAVLGGWLILCVYVHERRDALANDIFIILKLFAYQALATFFLALIVPQMFSAYEVVAGEFEYRSIALLFTYHETSSLTSIFKRPDGFFYEPGVFRIYLNLLLYLSLFYRQRLVDAGVAALALLTLQSTTGLLIASLIGLAFARKRWATAPAAERFLLLSGFPILLGPILVLTAMNTQDKLYGDSRGSAVARQYDAEAGAQLVLHNPLFGVGIDNERLSQEMLKYGDARLSVQTARGAERTTSNGVLELTGMLGIPFALFVFLGLFRQRFFRHKILFGAAAFLTFIGETLILTPFFMAIILSGLLAPQARQIARKILTAKPSGRQRRASAPRYAAVAKTR